LRLVLSFFAPLRETFCFLAKAQSYN
jgi:hypothetical protein